MHRTVNSQTQVQCLLILGGGAGCIKKVYKCSVCGDSYTEKIATSGHDFSEATCEKAATCKKCGLESGRKAAHKYERGACIWCGAAEPAAPTEPSEPVTEPTEPGEPPLEPIEP